MTADLATKGPGISTAQKIGDDARSALYANKPVGWNLGEIGGDDFGVDFQVTTFGPGDAGAQCYFNIQLKGTTQANARSTDGRHISYSFDRKTLNLWHNSNLAILVVVADLIDSRDPKEAKVLFHFANPDLDEMLCALPPDQKTVTLYVPTSQAVYRELDILPVVLPYLDDIKELRRQTTERRRARGAPSSETASIAAAKSSASAGSEIASSGEEIEAIISTVTRKTELKAALAALRSGDYGRVLVLAPAPAIAEAQTDPREAAVCAYLRARALEEMGDASASDKMIETAASLLPENDDIASLAAHKRLNAIQFGPNGHAARQVLLDSLRTNNGPSMINLKAKVYALDGDFETARKIVRPLPHEKSALTLVVVSIIENDYDRALSEIAISRSIPAVTEKQLFWLDALEAKAFLEFGLANVVRPAEGDFYIQSTGLSGIDYGKIRLAFHASLKAMLGAQRLNWPSSIQHLLDAFPISSMLLGYATQALPLLSALAFTRPTVTPIREVVAKFAVQFDQPQIALQLEELAGTSTRYEHETAVMAAAACKDEKLSKALKYATDDFLADPSTKDIFMSSLLLLGMAADSMLRLDVLEKIRTRLDLNTEARHYRAILDSALQVQRSPLRRPDAIRGLHAYWSMQGRPKIVAYHFLDNADPTDAEEAALIVEITNDFGDAASLGAEHLVNAGQALLTLNKIPEAIALLKGASERFDDDARLKSLLGIAYEINGQSADAFDLIGRLLESGEASETARRCFVEIAARMGFFDQAESQVRAAIARATAPHRRLGHLNTLFRLLLAAGSRPKELEEVAWEYGRLSKQEDEREEGIFLTEYLVATLPDGMDWQAERIQEFRQRAEAFFDRFPTSEYLRQAILPGDGTPEAILAVVREVTGITDQEVAHGLAIERKMDRGALHVPFSWRPKRFLRSVSDIFMLWHIRKQAPRERAAFHFQCSIPGYDRHTPSDLNAAEAVLSLTSLLLLNEIELLGVVLDTFPRVLVARATLISLQEARNTFTGGWEYEKATRIMRALQENFTKISHPPYVAESDYQEGAPGWHQEEQVAMQQAGRVYFCDDILETALVCGTNEKQLARPSICTVDFLSWADRSAGTLTPMQVSDALGLLARLKVGVTIEQRYLVAAIPYELQSARTRAAEEEAMASAKTLCYILDGIWEPSKPFDELRSHFAHTMSYLLTRGEAKEAVLVAFWLRWLQVVRFQIMPARNVWWKLAVGFVSTLSLIDAENQSVRRLWQSFWTAISRGLGRELQEPEDIIGVRIVAEVLGVWRGGDGSLAEAGLLFEKASRGIEPGTELGTEFSRAYVESVATQALKQVAAEKT